MRIYKTTTKINRLSMTWWPRQRERWRKRKTHVYTWKRNVSLENIRFLESKRYKIFYSKFYPSLATHIYTYCVIFVYFCKKWSAALQMSAPSIQTNDNRNGSSVVCKPHGLATSTVCGCHVKNYPKLLLPILWFFFFVFFETAKRCNRLIAVGSIRHQPFYKTLTAGNTLHSSVSTMRRISSSYRSDSCSQSVRVVRLDLSMNF